MAYLALTQMAALVVLFVAVAVHGPTDAAPQTDVTVHGPADAAPQMDVANESGDPNKVITIGGHKCVCKAFYLCATENAVKDATGSPEPGCLGNYMVCCKVANNESVTTAPTVDLTFPPEPPQVTNAPDPETPATPTNQCQCVPTSQCQDNDLEIDLRVKSCEKHQVCCNFVKPTENTKHPNGGDDGNNYVASCGVSMLSSMPSYTETRITSASDETYFGQFPWMVIILRTDIDEKTNARTQNVFQCGGSLVHPRFVLTAAHCVRNMDLKLMKVRLGEWHTQSSDNQTLEKNTHQDIDIYQLFIHPNHNNGTMYNDVALIELSSAVTLQPHIGTICIPDNDRQTTYDPESCLSMGWGKNGLQKTSLYQTVLKKVELTIVPNGLCQQQLRNTRLGNYFNLHESFICAGGAIGEDVCKGDGGGPLICAVKDENSKFKNYVQVGIVSWGIGCGSKDVPGIYSSVNYNSQWINQYIK